MVQVKPADASSEWLDSILGELQYEAWKDGKDNESTHHSDFDLEKAKQTILAHEQAAVAAAEKRGRLDTAKNTFAEYVNYEAIPRFQWKNSDGTYSYPIKKEVYIKRLEERLTQSAEEQKK